MGTITLPNFRATADVTMNTKLKDGGVYIDWSGLTNIKAWLYSDAQKAIEGVCDVAIDGTDSTKLVCTYAATKPQYLGVQRLIVQAKYMGRTKTYDKPVFVFVRWTALQSGTQVTIDDPVVDVEIDVEDVSSSILDNAIAAALKAAEDAEHAAHLVPLEVLTDCEQATQDANAAKDAANAAAQHATPYIGENGHWWRWSNEAGAYVDTGEEAKGDTGNGIQSVEQTQESQESEGENIITVTMTDGTTATFSVRNGKQGKQGIQGVPGAANAKYKEVDTLPEPGAGTMDFIYLTPTETSGLFNMSYTEEDEGVYSWKPLGTTAIQLSDYATKTENAAKMDRAPEDDTFYITDASGNIIAQIDSAGVSSVDVKVKVDGELVSVKSLLSMLSGSIATEKTRAETEEAKKLDHTLADDSLEIMDANGYIIAKIDASGVHSAKDKHAVACMVLGEYYYPTAAPTRDSSGNVTHAVVMFGTGVAGTLDITYTNGNASQVVAKYGNYTYTISISRDSQGNVTSVSVNNN